METDYKAMLDSVGKVACGGCKEMTPWKNLTHNTYNHIVLCPKCIKTADPDYEFERGSKSPGSIV